MKSLGYVCALLVCWIGIADIVFAREQKTESLVAAIAQHAQKVHVEGQGVVAKILADDNDGSRHQKFIIRTPEGTSILIAHNIDIANRVENLKQSDKVEFSGEYIWNEKGGVVHWTHHDPRGRQQAGWLKHKGVTYQ